MQTLAQIRRMLEESGLSPRRQFGQNFLYDQNLLARMVDLAELSGEQTVLEVGPGTGSLTEELLARAGKVVAAEIDRGLCRLLQQRLAGRPNFVLVCGDVLSGKHALAEPVLRELSPRAQLVSNLPYNIATPLIAQCLISSWHALTGRGDGPHCRFDRMVFTVQHEVAQRLGAQPGGGQYGPVSILAALLGRIRFGPAVPATSFWPQPKVNSRVVRIDLDVEGAGGVLDVEHLTAAVSLAFGQRRKQLGSILRRRGGAFPAEMLAAAFKAAGIDPALRAEQIPPEQFLVFANELSKALGK